MAKSKSSGIQTVVWLLINAFLVAAILLVLDYFRIWSAWDYFDEVFGKEKVTEVKKENPLLLAKEELDKQERSLIAREAIIKAREKSLNNIQRHYDQMILRLKLKSDQLQKREDTLIKQAAAKESMASRTKEQADKINNMAPAQAVKILVGLDTLEVIDIFRQMDRDAAELGRNSSVSYLIALIAAPPAGQPGGLEGGAQDPKKAQEIIRLMKKSPREEPQAEEAVADEE